jgi:sec-independent protein translocase protein TatB
VGVFNIGLGELIVLLLLGVLIFGPDKLPRMARDAGRLVRQLRTMADGAKAGLRSELGEDFGDLDLSDLNPRTFVRRYVLDDDAAGPGATATAVAGVPAQTQAHGTVRPLAPGEHPPFDPDAT